MKLLLTLSSGDTAQVPGKRKYKNAKTSKFVLKRKIMNTFGTVRPILNFAS